MPSFGALFGPKANCLQRDSSMRVVTSDVRESGALPFETLTGVFEAQPHQLVGPLQEFPALAPSSEVRSGLVKRLSEDVRARARPLAYQPF
jgi:hypothetical protein